ncbi:hypothetical protein ACE02P_14910 [Shewanella bicestrii]|uniref:hypothetical protein n=1 Tax=Shewanella xiamenensis TaxID=332186 RepID=UPI00217D4E64|nr:hypothetical protein [Shewanella xiamenensis]MCT8869026.1 hypothetical protein [Shewanella xiamenensis]MCT8873711.1 hypothetical protein [Shewanella xiamenensis]UWH40018.1 hypothetical protein KXJ80_00505 [Shewanella xiamenensis]
MSLNPPTLSSMSKVWYSAMNGTTVPTLPHDTLITLNHRYSVFDRNINNIVSILSHGLKMGYLSQEQVMLAVNEQDNIKQIEAISNLLAKDYWNNFTTQVSEIINLHKNNIRLLVIDSLQDNPDLQRNLLESYDGILGFYEKVMDLSLSLSDPEAVGTHYQFDFAVKVTFRDAVNSQFDVQKYAFDPHLKCCLVGLVEKIMPHQFECPTAYLHESDNNWLLEEIWDECTIKSIMDYFNAKGFNSSDEIDTEQMCIDLKINDGEMIDYLNDYGVDSILDCEYMNRFVDEINGHSGVKLSTLQEQSKSLSKKYPELTPLNNVFSYFEQNIKPTIYPFEEASDVDTSSQFFYSYNHPAEIWSIENAMERFYAMGELAVLNMNFDHDIIQYFNNYAITTCLKSLIMAVIELRD